MSFPPKTDDEISTSGDDAGAKPAKRGRPRTRKPDGEPDGAPAGAPAEVFVPEARPEPGERPKPLKAEAARTSQERTGAAAARPGASEAHHAGAPQGQPVDSGASRASYAALVVAEIQAHRYYPESARAHGVQGAVGVAFTIGTSGRVASASVVRPSGSAELNDAARAIVRSIAPPPPPGGSFSASTTIRFHFE